MGLTNLWNAYIRLRRLSSSVADPNRLQRGYNWGSECRAGGDEGTGASTEEMEEGHSSKTAASPRHHADHCCQSQPHHLQRGQPPCHQFGYMSFKSIFTFSESYPHNVCIAQVWVFREFIGRGIDWRNLKSVFLIESHGDISWSREKYGFWVFFLERF